MKNLSNFRSLLAFLLFFSPCYLFSQTFVAASSNPTDGNAKAGPTTAVTPPGSMVVNDLVVIYAEYRGTGVTISMSASGGQTWNNGTAANNGSNQTIAIFWCKFNGAWGTPNPSVTVGAGANGLSAVMYVFRPSNSSSSWGVNVNPTNTSSATNPNTVTGVTTTASNTVTMAFWSSGAVNTWNTLTAGWDKPTAQYRNTTSGGQSHTGAYKILGAPGATGNVSQTQSVATTALRTIMSWYERPPNDNCANATLLTTASTCMAGTNSLTGETLNGATADGGTIGTSCSPGNYPDVWYQFVAQSKYPVITVSNLGTSWTNQLKIQLLSRTGPCSGLTQVGCGNNSLPAASYPLMPSADGLTIGNTYYIRIQKNSTAIPTGGAAAWAFDICVTDAASTTSGRMNEVFKQTILSGPNLLLDPWEVTYGPDDKLWITEAKGYKVYRMDPETGIKTTVLDISENSTFLGADTVNIRCRFANGSGAQGGLAGLALHPNFMDGTANEKNYVYISYVFKLDSSSVYNSGCRFFKNKLVRFTYDEGTDRLGSPQQLCDTLPGGNDHNSQRIIIAPVVKDGPNYLFYASGDLGGGQLDCRLRWQKAQHINSYEGKILRFNLEAETGEPNIYQKWIPNDNPYFSGTSAVWSIGIRNNQGLAYDTANNILYGSSHGPYSDDEINIIKPYRNYGHPIVIGYASDGNYDGSLTQGTTTSVSAGSPYTSSNGVSMCPPIGSEAARKIEIDGNGNGLYKDPLFSAYAAPNGDVNTAGTIKNIWRNNPGNANPPPGWPSEGWSGLDLYDHTLIPGWKKSLVAASLKWGRLVRIRLGTSGIITVPSNDSINNASDTITYFGSQNRFRDLAFAPNGKDMYVVMDRSTTTSGPSAQWPVVPACQGCVQKYTFLGYADNGGKSSIPASIDVTDGTVNTCNTGTTITIDDTNKNLWVPITGPDGNIMAEIHAMGQNLGVVTSSFYKHSGAIRIRNGTRYLDRNIIITPQTQPVTPVKIRLYFSKAEYDALDADILSGVNAITNVKILKNVDACGSAIASNTTVINPDYAEAHGTGGYMLQGSISSFSSFYFGSSGITLPIELVYFKGSLQNNSTLLQWETVNENNASHFIVERSIDGSNFSAIGTVAATGNSTSTIQYSHIDHNINNLGASIIYYRLKMVDIDGAFKYSQVITISLADIVGKVVVSPNPASSEVKVIIIAGSEGKAQWKLLDNTGRVVLHDAIQLRKGSNNMTISLKKLSTGLYYLSISGNGIDQVVKLQKL